MSKRLIKILFLIMAVIPLSKGIEACINMTPSFTLTQNSTCGLPRYITLVNTSTGSFAAGSNYTWKLNDVVINKNKGLNTHKFTITTPGTYTIKLIVRTVSNCYDSTFQTINITTGVPLIKNGIGAFKHNPLFENCIKLSNTPDTFKVHINPQTTLGTGFKVIWGDGNDTSGSALTAGSNSVNHLYKSLGIFKITIISTGGPCPDTIFGQVINERTPVAGIIGPPTGTNDGCAPHIVRFINKSTNRSSTTEFTWDFADGEDTTMNALTNKDTIFHTYRKFVCNGTVTLTANNACGNSKTTWNPINISEKDSAIVQNTNFNNCDITKPFDFIAASTDKYCLTPDTKRYHWDFGDGSDTGYIINTKTISHKYASRGTYTVILTDSNACGKDTQSFLMVIDTLPLARANATGLGGCETYSTSFQDNSTGYVTSRSWTFDDPASGQNFSALQNPSHTFSKGGTFDVVLTVGNACGTVKSTVQILVIPKIKAVSTLPTPISCPPYSYTFVNRSVSHFSNATYKWDFGDGTTSTLKNPPRHTWTNSQNYNISLIATDSCGSDTLRRVLVIRDKPQTDFIVPDSVCEGNNATFTNTSTGLNIGRTVWDFDEGDAPVINGLANVSNFFDSAKTYNIMLISKNNFNCVDTMIKGYTVNPIPNVDFTMDTSDGCAPLLVSFTNVSQHLGAGSIGQMNFEWNFRNGNMGFRQDESNTFLNNPTLDTNYTVKLIGENSYGCKDSIEKNILVYPDPTSTFSMDTSSGCAPLKVEFRNNSIPHNLGNISVMSFKWDFDNAQTSIIKDPITFFNASQTQDTVYNVELISYSEHNCTDTSRQNVTIFPKPLARFAPDVDTGCRPLAVNFLNTSIPHNGGNISVMKFYWNLGNGILDSSVTPNNIYNVKSTQDSSFKISLIAESEHGCTDTVFGSVKLFPDAYPAMTVTPDRGCGPLNSVFINQSINAVRYEWYLPDNSILTTKDINQTFLGRPIFDSTVTVRLAAFTDKGCTGDTLNHDILIYPNPVAGYFIPKDTFCFPDAQQFFNQSLTAYKYEWDFGTTKSYLANPRHFFEKSTDPTKDTTHNIWLRATNAFGCHDTIHGRMTVLPYPKPEFSMDIDSGCSPFKVTFINTSKHVLRYEWEFGDGISSTLLNPVHEYRNLGSRDTAYQVVLYTHSLDCIDSDTTYVEVYKPSVSYFRYNRVDPCDKGFFQFINDSRNSNVYKWDFGDGATSNLDEPLHLFPTSGYNDTSFKALLITNSIHNCKDSLERQITLPQRLNLAIEDKAYNICTPGRINFKNLSTGGLTYFWDFGDGFGSTLKNPFHYFINPGLFTYKLTGYDKNGCPDSITSTQKVSVFKSPVARFDFDPPKTRMPYSTINFRDLSKSVVPLTHQWFFNDAGSSPNTSSLKDPSFKFSDSGWYNVCLVVDNGGCTDTTCDDVRIDPYLPQPEFSIDIDSGCAPLLVNFTNLTQFGTEYTWYFGDGRHEDTIHAQHVYQYGGFYDVTLVARGPGGESFVVKKDAIKVLPSPFTLFTVAPKVGYIPDAHFYLRNLTNNGVSYEWDVINPSGISVFKSFDFESAFQLHDTGWYGIQLIATSEFGCKDTLFRPNQVQVKPDGMITTPNAFSPNGDGHNDDFKPAIVNAVDEAYVFNVFNRWGVKIFETNDIKMAWNGKHKGKKCPQGLYVYTTEGRFYDGQEFEIKGQFILIR